MLTSLFVLDNFVVTKHLLHKHTYRLHQSRAMQTKEKSAENLVSSACLALDRRPLFTCLAAPHKTWPDRSPTHASLEVQLNLSMVGLTNGGQSRPQESGGGEGTLGRHEFKAFSSLAAVIERTMSSSWFVIAEHSRHTDAQASLAGSFCLRRECARGELA